MLQVWIWAQPAAKRWLVHAQLKGRPAGFAFTFLALVTVAVLWPGSEHVARHGASKWIVIGVGKRGQPFVDFVHLHIVNREVNRATPRHIFSTNGN